MFFQHTLNSDLDKIALENLYKIRFGNNIDGQYIDFYGGAESFVRLLIRTTAPYGLYIQTYANGVLSNLFKINADI